MNESYDKAYELIESTLINNGKLLDCGAYNGYIYSALQQRMGLDKEAYYGIEWNQKHVNEGREKGLNIEQGDLNKGMKYNNDSFDCICALSVLEHLLNPCKYLAESHRVLKNNGRLVLLTPNISTYFTAVLILLGKMPSTGPHPDSEALITNQQPLVLSDNASIRDIESDTPVHRHLVVFSYRVLHRYLQMIGFREIQGYGFGLYPFPNFMQPWLEKIDPYHCHQMVFVATK
ncbi:MAG: hypothetical protein CSA50_00535 [Gammaproteobacteria bacterium]|nr:MAG: hypothetical protein CSA50_00535 [Gammaproteobacteria bacterium]